MLLGRFQMEKNMTIGGSVTYNNDDLDHHFPQLTVQETLQFAHQSCGRQVPQRILDLLVSSSADDNARASLCNYWNTILGNAMMRGVSGGESKRVTVGEMEFESKPVKFSSMIPAAKSLKKTIVIALLQPSPEVFDLFDDVMIMNEGHVMYHGPRSEALSYFESFGFKCPPNRDVADFLLDLGTPQHHQYVDSEKSNVPRYPADFENLFNESTIYH
ncbi:hypothetical protein AC1031_011428 [Aphanomyces cochlioides]|nr:hypothetical protein AC1031_011428 [Aphanomyces cochlioides]